MDFIKPSWNSVHAEWIPVQVNEDEAEHSKPPGLYKCIMVKLNECKVRWLAFSCWCLNTVVEPSQHTRTSFIFTRNHWVVYTDNLQSIFQSMHMACITILNNAECTTNTECTTIHHNPPACCEPSNGVSESHTYRTITTTKVSCLYMWFINKLYCQSLHSVAKLV